MLQLTDLWAKAFGRRSGSGARARHNPVSLAVLGLLLPGAALALGLGEIRLRSTLNAPLDAEIELLGATAEELAGLQPRLASRDTFARYGIDYPAYLANISLRVVRSADGRNVVQLRSTAPITEPFATVLVEAVWPRGRFIREYSVLLDPPVFAPAVAAAPAPVAAPVVSEATRAAQVPAQAAVPRPAGPAPEAGVNANPAAGTYQVRRGDTVSGIAAGIVGETSNRINQAVVAIYQGNTAAFDGNVNLLRSGAILRLPDAAAISAIDANQALLELRRQATQWRSGVPAAAPEPRLKLVPPAAPAAPPASTTAPAAGSTLESRVAALESQLAESRRLLELRNAELAAAQAAAQRATAPQPAAPVEQVSGQPAAPAAPVPATPAPVAAPKPVVPAAAPAPASQPGALSEFIKDYGMVTVAVAALLLLLGLLAVRRARAQRADADLLAEAGDDEQLNADRYRRLESNTQPLRSPNIANIDNADPSFLVEETAQQLPVQEPARPVRQVVPVVAPVLVATPAIDLAADALQEADLYMAYGLFDQAAVMLRKSLAHEPTRRDLWLKLLEVCFVWGNKDAFCEAARELAKTRSESTAAEWDQILIMGRQLAPEDPLFAESVSAAASSGAVDLNLEGGHSRVDFDMFGQTQVDPQAQAVELDFSDVFDEKDAEATIVSDESLDFQFDDPQRGSDLLPEDTVTNLEPVLKLPVELDIALDDDEENGAAGHLDRTAELAIDDLDLGHMDPTDSQRIDDSRVARALESNVDLLEAELPPISDITGAWELPAAAPLAAQPAVAASVAAVEPTPVEPEPVDSASLSEVGTKLDLARAYIDMGDPEGARSIIEEVMLEGSAAQKQEGQRLLSTIPG